MIQLPISAQIREHLDVDGIARNEQRKQVVSILSLNEQRQRAKWDAWLAEFGAYWTVIFADA